jgi:hypothetical protein
MSDHIGRIHVEVPIQPAKAEEGSTLVTSPAFPFGMVDAA